MKRILLMPAIFAFLIFPCLGLAQQSESRSDADYSEIIKFILSDQRLDKRSFLSSKEQRIARLSTENVKAENIPDKVDGVKIEKRNKQQIEEDKKNGRRHYTFGKFNFNDSRVMVVLFYYAKNYESQPLIEVTVEYEYRKTDGKWKFISKRPNATVQ